MTYENVNAIGTYPFYFSPATTEARQTSPITIGWLKIPVVR